ncbi:family A G protein-coupled receptor-like protein [Rhizoclosmatium globosum]|uniref:Family A G protein-coupled receptor-like protein n=1 Tax=Rhizoclosmatium globosum TaxID=329046 RepID=A0A1Y2D3Q0_9FUNG|nr:family A G protein-coupled receptor-like protein [Rhizoclosmatium globosum]|eukprot:ORY53919.1 family A G protein-coupled receptor-like protein [Rhizoclosmatium globosum]
MSLTPNQRQTIQTIFRTLGSISLASNLGLVFCVTFNKRFHKPISYLQTCLAWCEIVQSIIYLIGPSPNDPLLCTIVGGVAQFTFNAVTFWSFCISLYCYITVHYRPMVANRYWVFFHLYSWGLAALSVIIMFWVGGWNIVGDATFECWISSERKDLRVWLFYVQLWVHFFLLMLLFIGIFRKIQRVREAGIETRIAPKVNELEARAEVPDIEELKACDSRRNTLSHGKNLVVLLNDSTAATRNNSRMGSVVDFKVLDISQDLQLTGETQKPAQGSSSSRRGSGLSVLFPLSRRTTITTIGKKRVVHFKLILRATMIGFGFLVTWIPPTILRVWDLTGHSKVPHWLLIWTAVCFATSGLWNSGVFYLTWYWEDIISFFQSLIQKLYPTSK